jgi:hypothetical protein
MGCPTYIVHYTVYELTTGVLSTLFMRHDGQCCPVTSMGLARLGLVAVLGLVFLCLSSASSMSSLLSSCAWAEGVPVRARSIPKTGTGVSGMPSLS